ncbi:pyridoxal-phosphate dependent enzyme [Aquamicrobium defluvii]|uniref:Cysteine synthase B n=1 Tax=Aquamicrobium defluvii TaxID=69279 RepID=A0A4R6Y195_9HYPH|nr:pyridoxal-phosphate dependent enzyme [Aquamicrobium defluvii]
MATRPADASPLQTSRLQPPYGSVLDLIGQTPVVELKKFDTGPCRLFVKLESQNPGGSIKDRIALPMVADAERRGVLAPGGIIVEATAGNTGLGLVQVGIPKGYRIILAVPDKMSREKVQHLRALGAEVRLTRSDVLKGHPEYYQDMAGRIAAETPGAFYASQFANPANPLAHETTTGPEIRQQLDGDVDAVVVGRRFRRHPHRPWPLLCEGVAEDRDHPGRSGGVGPCALIKTGEPGEAGSWTVVGIGGVAIIFDGDEFIGLITRIDLINHLRRTRK